MTTSRPARIHSRKRLFLGSALFVVLAPAVWVACSGSERISSDSYGDTAGAGGGKKDAGSLAVAELGRYADRPGVVINGDMKGYFNGYCQFFVLHVQGGAHRVQPSP
ncbi:MAG: hypothetical protein JXA30_18010 [Deltaproteobacteria bacterium]|nr:hypothetical protein [Deltaproteobacteria bacterium]